MADNAILMGFSTPPTIDDLTMIAEDVLDTLPEDLLAYTGDLAIRVDDLPDADIEDELDLDSPYDLLALYRGTGIPMKNPGNMTNEMEIVVLYRRPVLDVWCETGDDLNELVRNTLLYEIGQSFGFSEEEIELMHDMQERDDNLLETVY